MVEIGPIDVPSWAIALGGGIGIYVLLSQSKIPSRFQIPFISGSIPFGDLGGFLILMGVGIMVLAFANWIRNTIP